jgi:hypothetical protein
MGGELSGLGKCFPATVYLMEWLFYLYRLLWQTSVDGI